MLRTFGQLAASTAVAGSFTGNFRALSIFQPAAAQLANNRHEAPGAPDLASHLSPSCMRTPKRAPQPLTSSFFSPVMAAAGPFETPRHATTHTALSEALTGEGSHVWAPHRVTPNVSKFEAIRRFSETSSDEGSPMSGTESSQRVRATHPRRHTLRVFSASDDGADSSGSHLVCNLVERFNNAQLYDSINGTP